MKLFQAELVEACNDLLKSVITRISSHQDPEVSDPVSYPFLHSPIPMSSHPQSQSETLCSLVCVLCSVPQLYCQAVQQLATTVLSCAHMLTQSIQG